MLQAVNAAAAEDERISLQARRDIGCGVQRGSELGACVPPCVVFLACVHLTLLLALFLSPGNSLVSLWCGYSMLASSL